MKKLICTTLALIPLTACADPNVKAYCDNIWKQSTPGFTEISSEHGVTIINKSPITQTYDVHFDNAIQYQKLREMPLDYSEPAYTPNAHQEHHLVVESGKTLYYGPVNIAKAAGFIHRGRYKTSATTTIIINGRLLDQCVHYTNVDII